MADQDFKTHLPQFIKTNENTTSHIFDVDMFSTIVDVGSQLKVDVEAVNPLTNDQLNQSSNDVVIVGIEDDNGDNDALNFDINLTRVAPDGDFLPAFGADFIAGQDKIEAAIEVTSGEIVGVPIVRWYVTAEHFPKQQNIWNGGELPQG